MRIALAADHNGVALKDHLIEWLADRGHEVSDLGLAAPRPSTTRRCARRSAAGSPPGRRPRHHDRRHRRGEQMACNKVPGVRAGVCHDLFTTEIARAHNDTNVLILGAKIVAPALAEIDHGPLARHPVQGRPHTRTASSRSPRSNAGSCPGADWPGW